MICWALWLKGQGGRARPVGLFLGLSRTGSVDDSDLPPVTREKYTLSRESVEAGFRLIVLGRNSYRL